MGLLNISSCRWFRVAKGLYNARRLWTVTGCWAGFLPTWSLAWTKLSAWGRKRRFVKRHRLNRLLRDPAEAGALNCRMSILLSTAKIYFSL